MKPGDLVRWVEMEPNTFTEISATGMVVGDIETYAHHVGGNNYFRKVDVVLSSTGARATLWHVKLEMVAEV